MEIKNLKTDDLIPYINNARHNDDAIDAVASSIKNFGFKVPVVVADDLTPEQVKAFRLADNKVGEIATWDDDMLNAELAELADLDFDMTDFGFEALSFESDDEFVEDDDFDVAPVEEPTSKLGQIYQLGRHRLMVGDSTDTKQVSALLDGKKADLLLTDPPYNIAYEGKTEEAMTIQNDDMTDEDFRQFLKNVYAAANDNMKPGATFYIWYADTESYNFRGAAR